MKTIFSAFFALLFCLNSLQSQCSCSRPDDLTIEKRKTKSERMALVPETKTPEELVDAQLTQISESLELDPFEEAVVRTSLIKSVKKRKEIQILQLERSEMMEEFEKINSQQWAELKEGLPEGKYDAFMAMFQEPSKKKKKKKKKSQAQP